jgi:hypothetical protein
MAIFRRTVATGMANIGVQPHIIEATLNLISGHKAGVAGIYNRAVYAIKKRQALDRWAEHVRLLMERAETRSLSFQPALFNREKPPGRVSSPPPHC